MKAILKDYSLTVDYCAFMLAIVIVCHSVDTVNTNYQWSAEEISKILNDLPRAKHPNYHVNPVALKQGLLLFKRHLQKWGISHIEMYQEEKKSLEFFDLEESRRSIEMKFGAYQSVGDDMDERVVLDMILNVRNKLLLLGGYESSIHESPCSVFGILYLPMITNHTPVKETPETSPLPTSSSQFMTTQFRVRKAPDQLGSRSIYNSTKKVLLSAVESFGDEHALFYLESAVVKLKKRKRNEIEEEVENEHIENSDNESEEVSHVISLEDDDRVVEAASNFAAKYITYTEQDKTDILNLFKVVLEVARERNMSNYERAAAKTTIHLLKENSYYSKLRHRTISRWYAGRHKNKKARGPKIDENFEEEVWGKLMHCVFEKVLLIYIVAVLFFVLCSVVCFVLCSVNSQARIKMN
jgi:hypothetical protein